MSVFKIEKNKNYTVMSNYYLQDKNLSYKAKGLLSFMLSLPDNWDYSLNGLCSISKESRDGIRSILKKLQDKHYLEIEKVRGNKGYFEYNYLIYEKPKLNNPDMEIPTQINTKIINTNKKYKIDKTKKYFLCCDLTQELIKLKYIDSSNNDLSLYDELFEELLNKYSFIDLIIKSRYIVSNIKSRNLKMRMIIISKIYIYFKTALLSNIKSMNESFEKLW